ncbi:MAG: hypothetical protein AAB510_00525 [Patescibacteria group bacterium]
MQKRNVLDSPRLLELKKEKHKIFLRKIYISIFLFFITVVALCLISRIDRLNISTVEVKGNRIIDTKVITKIVDDQTRGYYAWIFPKTNILFYPKNNIKDKLSLELERLEGITLAIKNNTVLEISVTERTGKFIWCGDSLDQEANQEKCYFLDDRGYLFDEAPYFSGDVYFKFYGSTSGDAVGRANGDGGNAIAGSYFEKENFQKFILFKSLLEEMGLNPEKLYVENENNAKMILHRGSTLGRGAEVLFKPDFDVDKVSENLRAAFNVEPLLSDIKNKYSSLLYIDVRFENKVYYKFK